MGRGTCRAHTTHVVDSLQAIKTYRIGCTNTSGRFCLRHLLTDPDACTAAGVEMGACVGAWWEQPAAGRVHQAGRGQQAGGLGASWALAGGVGVGIGRRLRFRARIGKCGTGERIPCAWGHVGQQALPRAPKDHSRFAILALQLRRHHPTTVYPIPIRPTNRLCLALNQPPHAPPRPPRNPLRPSPLLTPPLLTPPH